jgi:predicted signal transduction protein with EAL and GGDEF domain
MSGFTRMGQGRVPFNAVAAGGAPPGFDTSEAAFNAALLREQYRSLARLGPYVHGIVIVTALAFFGATPTGSLLTGILLPTALIAVSVFRLSSWFKARAGVERCACGFALFPSTADEPDELVRLADAALYRAKASGSGDAAMFDTRAGRTAASGTAFENDLRRAIDGSERAGPVVDYATRAEAFTSLRAYTVGRRASQVRAAPLGPKLADGEEARTIATGKGRSLCRAASIM